MSFLCAANLLLHLMTAIGRGQIHNHLELLGGMSHILRLEGALLGRIGPRETLVQIDATVEGTDADKDTPTDGFQHL